MVFTFVLLFADIGYIDKTAVVGLDNRVAYEAVVVDVSIVVSAASGLPHTILKFPFKPPVKI